MKKLLLGVCMILMSINGWCWGFFGHKHINYHAVFLLPPEMMIFYKKNIGFLTEHAVDPDKRRYAVAAEAPRHYIDMDRYGSPPYTGLPRVWADAVEKFSEDSLNQHGIGPWWVQVMMARLTNAFRGAETTKILRLSAELGHYIADLHVPLHASSNHNGQHTNQHGIHGFWESRIPEMLAEKNWDFFIGHAAYINDPLNYIWDRVIESAKAADTVLRFEKQLSNRFASDAKYAWEDRNGVLIRQYSSGYSLAYNEMLNNMVERRMRMSMYAVACFWYTAWANAGQPSLKNLVGEVLSDTEAKELADLNTG
ncbi:MAG: S1/P1 Nuclease, partial [Chitinophagaceae bacterium]